MPHSLPSDRSAGSRGLRLLVLALVVTTLAYLATIQFEFVYDDEPQIISNLSLTSWKTLPSLFRSHSWNFLLPNWAGNYYRPVFMSWLLVNRMLFGLNPAAWHATTLLVHLLATYFAFLVARQILHSGTKAGFVALLFGLHPIHVESVAWVSGVTDPLMAVFTLAALWAWVRGEREPDRRGLWQMLAVVFYAAGCLSKETAIFLPVIVVAYDVLFGREERNVKGVIHSTLRTWPLWTTAAAYMAARMVSLRGLVHPVSVPISYDLLTVPTIFWGYMRRLIWPVGMSVFYDTPPVTSLLQWRFWLPFCALIVFGIIAWRVATRSRVIALSLVWILVFLAPAIIGLPAFPIGEWVHDRYLYLPSFGICLLLVHLISLLPSERELFGFPAVPTAVVLVLSAAMAFGTSWEEQYWSNGFLLFARGANLSPNSSWAKVHLANEFFRKGDRENTDRLYEEAMQIDPTNWKNNVAYGLMLFYSGRYREADDQLARSIRLAPGDSNQYFYQGMSRFNLGNYSGAESAFREALRSDRLRSRYHFWLGFALEKQGRLDEAKREYQEELRYHPDTDTVAKQRLTAISQSPDEK